VENRSGFLLRTAPEVVDGLCRYGGEVRTSRGKTRVELWKSGRLFVGVVCAACGRGDCLCGEPVRVRVRAPID